MLGIAVSKSGTRISDTRYSEWLFTHGAPPFLHVCSRPPRTVPLAVYRPPPVPSLAPIRYCPFHPAPACETPETAPAVAPPPQTAATAACGRSALRGWP